MVSVIGVRPSIPEYYRDYINKNVDLLVEPKQCCPFHKEDTPSFSYTAERRAWRCFGSCKCGGDIVDLHKKNYNLTTRKEAEESLDRLYKVPRQGRLVNPKDLLLQVDEKSVYKQQVYGEALVLANNIVRWVELDYVMSKYPVDVLELERLIDGWKGGASKDGM